jgi:hypothetical protein
MKQYVYIVSCYDAWTRETWIDSCFSLECLAEDYAIKKQLKDNEKEYRYGYDVCEYEIKTELS